MKYKIIAIVALGLVALTACESEARKEVRKQVETASETITSEVPPQVHVDGLEVDGDYVVCRLTTDDPMAIKTLADNTDGLNRAVFERLASDTTSEMAAAMQQLRDAGMQIKMVVEDNNGNKFTYIYNP